MNPSGRVDTNKPRSGSSKGLFPYEIPILLVFLLRIVGPVSRT